ncbi:hypothetical protein GUJ93_ZPchr0007g5336 [Zizania palustris]|uniref:Uncharacterized protein n=1 Tax=Zizania palustris TaxID=103762 RepID=A0A8J5SRI5_ZIZPA|nr:hypothetical protein GUJ93_ZPchr0007g5336 [Zizania palustris]
MKMFWIIIAAPGLELVRVGSRDAPHLTKQVKLLINITSVLPVTSVIINQSITVIIIWILDDNLDDEQSKARCVWIAVE